ncbi:RagB/SusD family nutrient uptake outer membrane protein [Parapedobacter sp. DT-150]|uniref:RagB/SusD family nutrient uptake outer membrane protein n=1 Tax=Parapedobacter sp. DT-150 TaxID=3396162 RepID=UPI003F1DA70D
MKTTTHIFLLISFALLVRCTASYLDVKPSSDILTPSKYEDFVSMLDNTILNLAPSLPIISGDEYELLDDNAWTSLSSATERNAYIWARDLFEGQTERADWDNPYASIFYANAVLDRLHTASVKFTDNQVDYLRGWALFIRSNAYLQLVLTFSKTYSEASASHDLGVPLRLSSDINYIADRNSLADCYDLIVKDLRAAAELLPSGVPPRERNRPSKEACFGLLSRVFLYMGNYALSESYADSALALLPDHLLDYNALDTSSTTPFSNNSKQIVFYAQYSPSYSTLVMGNGNRVKVSNELLDLYKAGDLRPKLFFASQPNGNKYFKRGYTRNLYPFAGFSVEELYLNKAECRARANDTKNALDILNTLLSKRYAPEYFEPETAADSQEALSLILNERRKELVWRGFRWWDIKRLNGEGANISLNRVVMSERYTLPPNDPRFVFPIPDDEISRSGIQQNER